MMSTRNLVFRYIFDEFFFGGERCAATCCQSYALGDAEYMGVNGHRRLVVDNRKYDVGGLASYSRQ